MYDPPIDDLPDRIDWALVGPISNRYARELLTSPGAQRDELYEQIVEELGHLFEVDRCYIFAFSEDGSLATNTYEWCAEGVSSYIEELQEVPVAPLAWFMDQLRSEGRVVIDKVSELGEEARLEREMFESEEIQSLLCVGPQGASLGFIGFDMVREERTWTDAEIAHAGVFASCVIHGLARERLELRLRRSIERFEIVSDLGGHIVFEWDMRAGRTVVKSANVEDILGYREEGRRQTVEWWLDKIHPEDRQRFEAALETAIKDAGVSVIDLEYRCRRRQGDYAVLRTLAKFLRDEEGKAIQLIGVDRDLTAELVLQEEMAAREQRFGTLLAASSDVLLVVDDVSKIEFASGNTRGIFGCAPKDLVGGKLFDRVAPESRAEAERLLAPGAEHEAGELMMIPLDQENYHRVEISVRDLRGDPVIGGFLIDLRDVTEKRRLEQRVRMVSRAEALARAAKRMGNEFNNVLMDIRTQTDLLEAGAGSEDVSAYVDNIRRAVRRGRISLDRVSTRVDPGAASLEVVRVEQIAERAEDLSEILPDSVTLKVDVETADAHIMTDAHQLLQVLAHLVESGARATDHSGTIEIGFRHGYGSNEVVIVVSDNGRGMDQTELERLFDPLSVSLEESELTMAWVQQVVQAHGAEISVSSRLGEGTTFRIVYDEIQLDDEDTPSSAAPAREPLQSVLMFEDELPVAAGIRAFLELEGLRVTVQRRGEEAIETVSEQRPDVIIMDVGLPDVDGVELYREIEKRFPRIPVVFSTGHGTEDEFSDLLCRPEVALLHKPYEMQRLIEALHEVYSG